VTAFPADELTALLAEHTAEWTDWDTSEPSEFYTCLCRQVRWHVNTSADYYAAHAAHLAAVVKAWIDAQTREALAKAWDNIIAELANQAAEEDAYEAVDWLLAAQEATDE
jgi:hypothetical protein